MSFVGRAAFAIMPGRDVGGPVASLQARRSANRLIGVSYLYMFFPAGNLHGGRTALGRLALGLAAVILFYASGEVLMDGYDLGLGSLREPTPRYGRFLAFWTVFGALGVGLLTAGLFPSVSRAGSAVRRPRPSSADRRWLVIGAAFALLIPILLRVYVLQGARLTDDESAYRFMAEILATGRLFVDSPPQKLFFDNPFLINDGRLYTQYFLGWPLLMVPGVFFGATGLMNAVYSAATLPAIFLVLRQLLGAPWARMGAVLYLASPMLMIGAATETSHTSCMMALSWLAWLCLKSRDGAASGWIHGGVAVAFAVAFFIRPATALGLGAPLLIWWGLGWLQITGRRRWLAALAFALPALLLTAAFLVVNLVQHGSVLTTGYERYYSYSEENRFLFSIWPAEGVGPPSSFSFDSLLDALANTGAALLRFNYAFLGWPCSLLFIAFAGGRGFLRVVWLSAAGLIAVHFFTVTVGIDTYAPMHYQELALPSLLLSAAGMRRLYRFLDRLRTAEGPPPMPNLGRLVPLIAATAIAVTLCGYTPIRLATIHRIARAVNAPLEGLARSGITRAVVFASSPFVDPCLYSGSMGWVFSRPNNDPGLDNDVLWVNHLSIDRNRRLMELFPDRAGYVMLWLRECRVVFVPLGELERDAVPDAAGLERLAIP